MRYLRDMKRLALFCALCACLTFSCAQQQEEQLKTGDLIFVGIPADYTLDEGSMDAAISQATGAADSLNLIHVAIAEVQGDSTWMIDATIRRGVDRHPLDTFLRDFTLRDGSLPVFVIKRLIAVPGPDGKPVPVDATSYVEQAKTFCGLPYDQSFLPENGALYCTELVRESYRTSDGEYLFANKPMNWKNAEGEYPLYWQQLFARLGEPIPQDVPGTNPQDMAESPLLETVPVNLP